MKIYVTKSDIKEGIQCSSGQCPIARSLQRRFPGRHVSVGAHGGAVGGRIFPLPPSAQRFIVRFDVGRKMRPFSFTLPL